MLIIILFHILILFMCFPIRTLSQLCGKYFYQAARHELDLIQKVIIIFTCKHAHMHSMLHKVVFYDCDNIIIL